MEPILYLMGEFNMKKIVVIFMAVSLCACATIIKGQHQSVQLTGGLEDGTTKVSTPTGVYTLTGGQTTMLIPRTKQDIPVEVTCNGTTQKTVIKTTFDIGWGGLGNIVFGGIPGWVIDGVGDKAYDAPGMFNVNQYCSQAAARSTANQK